MKSPSLPLSGGRAAELSDATDALEESDIDDTGVPNERVKIGPTSPNGPKRGPKYLDDINTTVYFI